MTINKNIGNVIGTWTIKFGYCTGNPQAGSDSWFTIETKIFNERLSKALFEARKEGYRVSGDVCADFLFSVHGLNGLVDEVETSIAMVDAAKMLFDEVEG